MKNNITELVFILDCGSFMQGMEGDAIGSLNSLIDKQTGVKGKCYVSAALRDALGSTALRRTQTETRRRNRDKEQAVETRARRSAVFFVPKYMSDHSTTVNIYAHFETGSKSVPASKMAAAVVINPGIKIAV